MIGLNFINIVDMHYRASIRSRSYGASCDGPRSFR